MAAENRSVWRWWKAGCLIVFIYAGICPENAHSIGQIRYQNPHERTLHVHGAVALVVAGAYGGKLPALLFETGQHLLYGVAGLKTNHIRIGGYRQATGLVLSSTSLSSPVGREYLLTIEPIYRAAERLALSVDLNLDRLSIHGFDHSFLVSIGASAVVRLSESLHLGYTFENIRLYGEELPGADTALHLVATPGTMVCVVTQLRVTREGSAEALFGSGVRLHDALQLALGYEDPDAVIGATVQTHFRSIGVSLGASLHPILGLSKAVFVSWRRQP
ncbi:MAG: hypothetical protein OEN01_14755 [Candidatus Krumholzibacteria bacterium]|nr:hypothetical protein [Candidatus Krumholzibacteria bacterium]